MKAFSLLLLALAVGCNPAPEDCWRKYDWVVERGNRSGKDVQADFDALARNGWTVAWDDDLEKSGHYVYFERNMTPRESVEILAATQAALDAGRTREGK